MNSVTVNVDDLSSAERQTIEHLIGQPLAKENQLIVQVVVTSAPIQSDSFSRSQIGSQTSNLAALPEWCHVYAGLSDEEVAELETVVLSRADFSRSFP